MRGTINAVGNILVGVLPVVLALCAPAVFIYISLV